MVYTNYPDYLQHYGVKGMKWGVRKAKQFLLRNHPRLMSSQDLKQYNSRASLQQQYKSNRRKQHPIRSAIADAFINAAKNRFNQQVSDLFAKQKQTSYKDLLQQLRSKNNYEMEIANEMVGRHNKGSYNEYIGKHQSKEQGGTNRRKAKHVNKYASSD